MERPIAKVRPGMLILSRRHGQGIRIGNSIRVTVVAIDGQVARLGIEAPASCKILRDELWELVADANKDAISSAPIGGDFARIIQGTASGQGPEEAGPLRGQDSHLGTAL